MNEAHIEKIAGEQHLDARQVKAVADLFGAEATVPFIARYRKEATGGLDEVAIIAIRDRLDQLEALDKRRETVLNSIKEQGKLTDDLRAKVLAADTLAVLEDLYLPYRPKRRTRATVAREKGLEPLARLIFEQGDIDPAAEAVKFVSPEKEVATPDDALAGARDIIAEWINEDTDARAELRELFAEKAIVCSKVIEGKETDGANYKDYFDWREPLPKIPSHRLLAIRRGAKEGFLTYSIQPDEKEALAILTRRFVKADNAAAQQVQTAVEDGYNRLLRLSMETEMRVESKKRADEEAIHVFAENLRDLLLAAPLGQKSVLAIDPGHRTGCKVVCLDRQGKLLHHDTIFPLEPQNQKEEAAHKIRDLVAQFDIEAIAVGNGTGGREAHAFCRSIELDKDVPIEMVNESGASVYSASKTAREEFPDKDVTVRGAVSIGRRLTDPLAELVKIDPKSIGVGQYQHDVDQKQLRKALDDVVTSCVNAVGVEVNTASKRLLSYVSGLGPKLAGAVVAHRNDHGPFRSRTQLMDVPGMGAKTFEQSAGFFRIRDGENPLDASAVHPESYPIVERMAADSGCTVTGLIQTNALRERVQLERYVTDTVGMPTLTDILKELAKPGRDPRKEFKAMAFAEGVREIGDVKPGMRIPGVVTNVTNFGAFVDVGVHQDGLVHISQLADRYVKRPVDVVKVGEKVTVTVLSVDTERGRIALSMRQHPDGHPKAEQEKKPVERRPKPKAAEKPKRPRKPRPKKAPPRPTQAPKRDRPTGWNNPIAAFFKDRKPNKN
ncbi:MAG: RNA-binding transcriptional accessory protein [Planctomycetes bacterium]|nr:RNA-binding transcriptional accessory protein [Planctomycetota bacterium]